MLVKLKRCHDEAKILSQEHGNVGFDIYAVERTELSPNAVTRVKTGLMIADYDPILFVSDEKVTVYPKIEGRSGLASKGIFPVGNIIDPNYRGEICVALANMNANAYSIDVGDRIAQLIFHACMTAPAIFFKESDDVIETSRGSKGFGSSGR